jgi:N,N'-diacetyllegionaminate synthase
MTNDVSLTASARDRGYPLVVAEIGAKYAALEVLTGAISAARRCGVDLVKFQSFTADAIATPEARMRTPEGRDVSQREFFKQYELSRSDHEALIGFCRHIGIGWFSTPSSRADVDLLEQFAPICYKTGSDDLTNLPLLRYIAQTGRPMVVSTGMSTMAEVEKAVETIRGAGNSAIVLLHCVVSYPSRPEDANLRAIGTLRERFGLPVGLSDHTTDEYTSVLAAAMGAEMIEKHFTPDHALKLQDDEASLDPEAMARLVQRVALVPKALGDGVKRVQDAEKTWRAAARKSLFAARDIAAGEPIRMEDLVVLRPAVGIGADDIEKVLGRRTRRAMRTGDPFTPDVF